MSDPNRGLWLAIFLIVGVLAGTAAAVLTWLGGEPPVTAVLAGGGGFVGSVAFLVMVWRFLAGRE